MTKRFRTINFEINGVEDVPVNVHYDVVPFRAGKTDGKWGPKLEPDEPGHIEIDYAQLDDGRIIELTKAQEDAAEEEICMYLSGYYDQDEPREREYAN